MRDTTHDVAGGTGPHAGRPIIRAGAPLGDAAAALVLVHGRGGAAADMLGLAKAVAPPRTLCLAPQAAGQTWYPYRFTEPVARNEPHLSSALSVLGDLVDQLVPLGRSGIHKENRPWRNGRHHRIALKVHADHMFGMRTP